MKPLYMLDTNICIYIARRRPSAVKVRFERFTSGQFVMSAITYGELWYGASKSADRPRAISQLDALLKAIPIEPLDSRVAERYGEIRAALERQGRVIGNNDLWIGAHAAALGITLATSNKREFKRISGLAVENWAV